MLKLLADENFNNDILRGVLRILPDLDFLRVQDVGLHGADDVEILAWAAAEGRLVCTHDLATMTKYANERVIRGEPLPGVLAMARSIVIATAIEDIVLIVQCTELEEWRDRVSFLPLR